MGIHVRATRAGVYGHYREPGDEFEIKDEKAFAAEWMERLGRRAAIEQEEEQPKKGKKGKPSEEVI